MKRIIKPNTSLKDASGSYYNPYDKLRLTSMFPQQDAFVKDDSRYIAAQCSRRAGKSNGLALRFFNTMYKYPGCSCIYLALTKDSAKDIMWPVLQELNDKYNLGCEFKESKLIMTHPNGSRLMLYGADMPNFIRRLKGQKSPGIGVDESQDFGVHLESLINDVLTPMLVDYKESWLAIVGTPGPVPQGYYFEVTNNKRFGYSVHSWTILDNPYIVDAKDFIADMIAKREWQPDHPTLRREWRNEWVLDTESLWIRYKKEINDFDTLPLEVKKWNYVMGIDIGFKDADAIAVLAWSDECKTTYLVEEIITTKQDITSLMEQIESTRKKYNAYKMVIDQGGLGLKIAEEMRRRHAVPVEAADKKLKAENVGILNDELRLGKLKARANSRFAQDSYMIQIDWKHSRPDKIVIKKDPHSDIIDAVLYAHKESYAFTYEPEVKKPKYGSKEWAEAQQGSMFEAELAGMQQEQDINRKLYGDFD